MSMIAPNGQVRFLSDVPLDYNYENSIDWLSEGEQRAYFLGLSPVHTMANATRIREGVIRVDCEADLLYSCNYLMFQNQNFSGKWFYAFVRHVEYVNNNMSHVYYEIDDIQTWMFQTSLSMCYVEREHTATDRMFEHLIDEGIQVSEYKKNNATGGEYDFGVLDCVLYAGSYIADPDTSPSVVTSPCMPFQGNFNGLTPRTYHIMDSNGNWNQTEIDRMSDYMDDLTTNQQTDSIACCIMFPADLIQGGSEAMKNPIEPRQLTINNYTVGSNLDGYVPKNKKLYNSPYCVIAMGTSDGQTQILQPEYLANDAVGLIHANVSPTPSVMIMVDGYKGKRNAWDTAITFDAFPQVAIALDGYKAWVASGGLARLQLQTGLSVAKDVLQIGGGVAQSFAPIPKNMEGISGSQFTGGGVGQIVNGALNLAGDIGNAIISMDVAKSLPPNIKGSSNTQVLSAYLKLRAFTEQRTINHDVAESIDNYFTMFGYKVNKVKVPSRRNRPYFTYVKTKGCNVDGAISSDVIEHIEEIYNRGIRFWTAPQYVGNYSLNNSPS